jgi:predicted exporter
MADKKIKSWLCLAALLLMAAVSLTILSFSEFHSDVTAMLPGDSDAVKMLEALHDSRISGKIVLELRLADDSNDHAALIEAVDRLIPQLVHPDIVLLTHHFKLPGVEDVTSLRKVLPDIASDRIMAAVEQRCSPENIDVAMKRNFFRIASSGIGLPAFIQADPLGFNNIVLPELAALSRAFNYRIYPGVSRLIGHDRRRALIIMDTDIPVTAVKRSTVLLEFISTRVDTLGLPVTGRVICGHKHTVGNARTLKGDIIRVSIASLLIFIVMFMLIYRLAFQCFYIILIPALAVLFTIAAMSLFMASISGFIVGLGGVIAGIAVDYGIHIYSACGKDGRRGVRSVIRPLAAGAFTTMGIFAAFFFSGVMSYIQLGIFALASVTMSFLMAVLVLPILIDGGKVQVPALKVRLPDFSRRGAWICLWIWSIICLASLAAAIMWLKPGIDVRTIDGAGENVFADERDFNEYWTRHDSPAMLIVKASTREAVLRRAEDIRSQVAAITANEYISPVVLIPSQRNVTANRERWMNYWNDERIFRLRHDLARSAAAVGFKPDAFVEFVDSLTIAQKNKAEKDDAIDMLSAFFIRHDPDGQWRLFSYFPDKPEYFAAVKQAFSGNDDLSIISPAVLRDAIAGELFNRLLLIGIYSLCLVAVLSVVCTGGIVRGICALLPVLSALSLLAGGCALSGISVSIPVCIAAVIVVGLAIDYGIFLVFQTFDRGRRDMASSVFLSAMTTAAGAGALLFANHPVLFYLGLFLSLGVLLSCAAAFTIVPAMALLYRKGRGMILNMMIPGLLLLVLASGCVSVPPRPLPLDTLNSEGLTAYRPPQGKWRSVAKIDFEFNGHMFSVLCIAELDGVNRKIALAGIDPASGMRVFEAASVKGTITHQYLMPRLERLPDLPRDVIKDISRISFDVNPGMECATLKDGLLEVTDAKIVYAFDPESSLLVEKRSPGHWQIFYRDYKLLEGFTVPHIMQMYNFHPGYYIKIEVKEFKSLEEQPHA